jgi:glycine betaine/proline transport system ATP-binding protein
VLSAEQIMQPLRAAAMPGDSPRVVLRKMERSGFGGLLVVDHARHMLGFVRLADVTAQRDRAQLDASTFQPRPMVTADSTLSDVIQRIHAEGSPVAVVDARQRVVGVVDKNTVLAALAQGDANAAAADLATATAGVPAGALGRAAPA